MGGFFGVASKEDCVFDLFFGIDYHSHLGTRRGGMVVYGENGFDRSIHNIENAPFRTKFDKDIQKMKGNLGIGCISDYEPQPLLVRSHHGTYAITTVSKINNEEELTKKLFENGHSHFLEMSGGDINATELIAALINQKANIIEGIHHALEEIDGSVSILLMNQAGIYAARDKYGRTPVAIGKKDDAYCVSFENYAYKNLGYSDYKELGPGEIVVVTDKNCVTLMNPNEEMKICTFLWVYYGYPASSYEGNSVENMRYRCGRKMAQRDTVKPDIVAGVPDSGIAHAIGYANESGVPFSRPFIKYTPTWSRSFIPTLQSQRNQIAKMKILAVEELIRDKSLLLIDDSIVRGTQLRDNVQDMFDCGAKEVHIRISCPPLIYPCKFLNFTSSKSEMELITRQVIAKLEGGDPNKNLEAYAKTGSPEYNAMVEEIGKRLKLSSLKFSSIENVVASIGLPKCKICTHCFDGSSYE